VRLAIDARELPHGVSGDRTYLLGVLREAVRLAPDDEFLLCYNDASATGVEAEELPSNVSVEAIPCGRGWLWTPVAWPRWMRRKGIDVAHAMHLIPPFAPCPTVVTVHDLSFLVHPEWFPRRQARIMRRLIPLSARRATHIITGTEHAAQSLVELCHVRRDKITVIPHGVDPRFTPGDRDAARELVAARHGLHRRFVLAVGLIQPRKNLARLIDAFALLSPDHDDLGLAIVGRTGWEAEAVTARIEAAGLGDRVVLCGAVSDRELPDLFRAAELLVYPSLYEGFGLPPLEAMACGTPVVASNTTSLPEVVGEAGILVDPYQVEAIAEGLRTLVGNQTLCAALSRAGLERAATFTWRRSAEQHLELFRRL
jgi:glycosyltransferase involved in cell wall biosynthesis